MLHGLTLRALLTAVVWMSPVPRVRRELVCLSLSVQRKQWEQVGLLVCLERRHRDRLDRYRQVMSTPADNVHSRMHRCLWEYPPPTLVHREHSDRFPPGTRVFANRGKYIYI